MAFDRMRRGAQTVFLFLCLLWGNVQADELAPNASLLFVRSPAYSKFIQELVALDGVLEELRRGYFVQRCKPTEFETGTIPLHLVQRARHQLLESEAVARKAKYQSLTYDIFMKWAELQPSFQLDVAKKILASNEGRVAMQVAELKNSFSILEQHLTDTRSGALQGWPMGVWVRYLRESGYFPMVSDLVPAERSKLLSANWSDDPASKISAEHEALLSTTEAFRFELAEKAIAKAMTPELRDVLSQLTETKYFEVVDKFKELERTLFVGQATASMQLKADTNVLRSLLAAQCRQWSSRPCSEAWVKQLTDIYEYRNEFGASLVLNSVPLCTP